MSLYDLELEPPFSDVVTDDELAVLNIKDLNRFHLISKKYETSYSNNIFVPTKKLWKSKPFTIWNHSKNAYNISFRKLKEKGLSKEMIEKLKQRRRTLKNRKYATE